MKKLIFFSLLFSCFAVTILSAQRGREIDLLDELFTRYDSVPFEATELSAFQNKIAVITATLHNIKYNHTFRKRKTERKKQLLLTTNELIGLIRDYNTTVAGNPVNSNLQEAGRLLPPPEPNWRSCDAKLAASDSTECGILARVTNIGNFVLEQTNIAEACRDSMMHKALREEISALRNELLAALNALKENEIRTETQNIKQLKERIKAKYRLLKDIRTMK